MGLFDGTSLERPVLCDQCGADVRACDCVATDDQAQVAHIPPEKQRLRLRLEKRKRGKIVTVVNGLQGDPTRIRELLTILKNHCGAGGSLEETQIEIQGDHTTRIRERLQQLGYRVQ